MVHCSPKSAATFPTRIYSASICPRSSPAAFSERQRAGEFGGAYVHFFHRNLFDRIFEPDSIDDHHLQQHAA